MQYERNERLWERLHDFLSTWATAEEVGPDRIEVSFESPLSGPRVATLVMTRDEWDELVSVPYGDFDVAAEELRKWLLELPPDHGYLVYNGQYELQASKSEVLPPSDDDLWLEEMRRKHLDGVPGGTWSAHLPGEPS